MPDSGGDSRLDWLVEPQRHDVALQQPILVATIARDSTGAAGAGEGMDTKPGVALGAGAAEAADTAQDAPERATDATEAGTCDAAEHVIADGEAVGDAATGKHSVAAGPDTPDGTALERRKTPLSVRLVTVVRGTGAPLGTLGAPRKIQPRSFFSQFVIAMVATMTIFTTLALASPIAGGSPFRGSFESVAGAVPFIPTPTPTPKPTPTPAPPASGYGFNPPHQANPGAGVVQDYIRQVFGPWARSALAVARCESGYDPNAWNPYPILGSHASGVFQILYQSTWDETPYWQNTPYDYRVNIQAAFWLFSRDGHTWREWACGTILGYN